MGTQLPPPKRGTAPNFRSMSVVDKRLDGSRCHLVRRQASAQAMHIVLDGDPAPPKRGNSPPNFRPMLIVASGRPSQLLLSTCCLQLKIEIEVKNSTVTATLSCYTEVTRMWANAQPDGRPAEFMWRPVLNAAKFGSWPPLDCRAVTLRIEQRKTWRTQSEFCTWQIPLRNNSRRKSAFSLPAQVRAKHCAKFGWLPLSDVAAVTKPRREGRCN